MVPAQPGGGRSHRGHYSLLAVAGFAGVTWNYWRAEAARRELETTLYFQRIALAHRELSADNLGRALELLDGCPQGQRQWEWHYLERLLPDRPAGRP